MKIDEQTAREVAEALGVTPKPSQIAALAADLGEPARMNPDDVAEAVEAKALTLAGVCDVHVSRVRKSQKFTSSGRETTIQWEIMLVSGCEPYQASSGKGASPWIALGEAHSGLRAKVRTAQIEARIRREIADEEAMDRDNLPAKLEYITARCKIPVIGGTCDATQNLVGHDGGDGADS